MRVRNGLLDRYPLPEEPGGFLRLKAAELGWKLSPSCGSMGPRCERSRHPQVLGFSPEEDT